MNVINIILVVETIAVNRKLANSINQPFIYRFNFCHHVWLGNCDKANVALFCITIWQQYSEELVKSRTRAPNSRNASGLQLDILT